MKHNTIDGGQQRYFGLYPAIVTDLVDSEELGRIQVRFPWLGTQGEEQVRAWATLLSPYADDNQGFQALPEVESQVVVGFEAGNLSRPYIVGCCWNGSEALPTAAEEANNLRVIKTREESVLEFDDTSGSAKITLATRSGHQLKLDAGESTITLTHSNGSVITLAASGKIEIQANAGVEVTAPVVNVHAGTTNFDGAVNCTTLTAKSAVVSPSYSQGAGNVW